MIYLCNNCGREFRASVDSQKTCPHCETSGQGFVEIEKPLETDEVFELDTDPIE